jgi:hypothetical protein
MGSFCDPFLPIVFLFVLIFSQALPLFIVKKKKVVQQLPDSSLVCVLLTGVQVH